jgi:rubrerythrin
LTVQSDLKKALASAQSALGSYSTFAESTQDQSAKQMFQQMAQDMQRHIDQLNSRLSYIEKNNPLNQQQNNIQ